MIFDVFHFEFRSKDSSHLNKLNSFFLLITLITDDDDHDDNNYDDDDDGTTWPRCRSDIKIMFG